MAIKVMQDWLWVSEYDLLRMDRKFDVFFTSIMKKKYTEPKIELSFFSRCRDICSECRRAQSRMRERR